mgnify:CR=1 FL=1
MENNSTRENRMKPKLKPLLINRQIDFESVTKTAPVMAIIETDESPIESAVHDLRVAIEQEVKKKMELWEINRRKQEMEQRKQEMAQEEEKLFFFENYENTEEQKQTKFRE